MTENPNTTETDGWDSTRLLQYSNHVEDWSDDKLVRVLQEKESRLERLEFECERLRERLQNREDPNHE